jgi:hypothetical protein
VGSDWVHLVRRPLRGLLYRTRMIDDQFGESGGMRIGRGNRKNRGKPAPVPLRPPHDLIWDRTRAAEVGSRRLTAWAMAWTWFFRTYLRISQSNIPRSRDSAVGIATGYRLDDRGVVVRVPEGSRIFSSPRRPNRLWGPSCLLSIWYHGGTFPGAKAAGEWRRPLTSN